jgi:hypothetical protein
MKRTTVLWALALLSLLAFASPAHALTRFAEPNGDGPSGMGECLASNPCSIQTAVEDPSVQNGDEVILLPGATGGVYEDQGNTLSVDNAITLRSRETDPRPVIPMSGGTNFGIQTMVTGVTLRRLRIEAGPTASSGLNMTFGGTIERLYVRAAGLNQSPCALGIRDAALQNSVCYAANGGDAIFFGVGGAGGTVVVTARNVTAVAPGAGADGIQVDAGGATDLTLFGINVIASGGATDVRAQTDSASGVAAEADLANSNYDTRTATGTGATVTAPGTDANQVAAPQFLNAGAGNFRQAASSPTIDGGDPQVLAFGGLDLDDTLRSVDGDCDGTAAPDIGAYEFTVSCAGPPGPPPGDGGVAPSNEFNIGKAKKNKKKGTAKLTVDVPGPGTLDLDGKSVKPATNEATAAGEVKLKIKAKGKKKKKLNQAGKAKVKPEVTYTPTGGSPNTKEKRVKLVKK